MTDKLVTVFSGEQYDSDWPQEDAKEFIAWFQSKLDSIPAEYRDKVTIDLESESGYESSSSLTMDIYYYRPETKEEEVERLKVEQERANSIKNRDPYGSC